MAKNNHRIHFSRLGTIFLSTLKNILLNLVLFWPRILDEGQAYTICPYVTTEHVFRGGFPYGYHESVQVLPSWIHQRARETICYVIPILDQTTYVRLLD